MWEIAIKRALGKLEIGAEYVSEIAAQGFVELPIRWEHLLTGAGGDADIGGRGRRPLCRAA